MEVIPFLPQHTLSNKLNQTFQCLVSQTHMPHATTYFQFRLPHKHNRMSRVRVQQKDNWNMCVKDSCSSLVNTPNTITRDQKDSNGEKCERQDCTRNVTWKPNPNNHPNTQIPTHNTTIQPTQIQPTPQNSTHKFPHNVPEHNSTLLPTESATETLLNFC